MKKHVLIAFSALAIGLSWPQAVRAHDMSPSEREKHLDKMATELNLTQDQKNKIRTIKEDKYQRIEAIEKDADDKIRAELKPDQQAKFDKMKEKHHKS